jgi:NAD(P)-dependent dehydrogenase (short-subunit alcohol dehydrogenase family)
MGVTEVVADLPLSGRIAMVTGAAQGVGRACALALARAGCFVAACDEDGGAVDALDETALLCERESGRANAFTANVTNPEEVERLWVEVTAALGAPIVLVNGVGATPPKPLGDTSPTEWQADVRAHLDAAFYCARAVLPAMRAAGFGRILNVARAPTGEALVALARTLADEEKDHGITVNAVVAGHARADEIGRVVAFLASPASESITGARILVGRIGKPQEEKA